MGETMALRTEEVRNAQNTLQNMATEIGRHYYAPEEFIGRFVTAAAARGHVIMEATPGTGKTVLANGFANMVGGSFGRVQGTPDLLPFDITGTEVANISTGDFAFREGPVFNDIVLIDEINRMNSKTQSALLEAMQERQVTVGRESHKLPRGFKVIATQNPFERAQQTNRLGDAQKDRFAYGLYMPSPTREEKMRAIMRSDDQPEFLPILENGMEDLLELQGLAERVGYSSERVDQMLAIEAAIATVSRSTSREDKALLVEVGSSRMIGNSARGGRYLLRLAQMNALADGRVGVEKKDIYDRAVDVYAMRVEPSYHALENKISAIDIVNEAVERVRNNS